MIFFPSLANFEFPEGICDWLGLSEKNCKYIRENLLNGEIQRTKDLTIIMWLAVANSWLEYETFVKTDESRELKILEEKKKKK